MPAKSQWDFGELFPPEPRVPERKVLSVSELTTQIRCVLEKQLGAAWVTGEITNLKIQPSGHIYFTLKDSTAQLSCVLFRGEVQVDRSLLQDGRKVNLQGELTVYEVRGQYQLRVLAVELEGAGALQAAFEKLKKRLEAEGLFAAERKRALPRYPQRIGLVTSPAGAAIQDVIHVVERRNPSLQIIVAPCRVQGQGAGAEIAAAIRLLNEFDRRNRGGEDPNAQNLSLAPKAPAIGFLDLILVTRGGGSLEDLWAFNEEVVARAIYQSALPVVSAVGHEIDFTISDFVADVRAATPSVAAEIITEGVFSSCQFFSEAARWMRQLVGQQWDGKNYLLGQTLQRLARVHPRRKLNDWIQRLDDSQTSLLRCAKQGFVRQQNAWQTLAQRLNRVRPAALLRQRRDSLRQAQQRLREQMQHRIRDRKNQVAALEGRLRLLGPEQVLARGYSITTDAESGKVLRDAKKVTGGQRLRTRLKAGELLSTADEPDHVREGKEPGKSVG